MASNFLNNLSNTYQQSPSLQNQFATEQDYLDLFDNNQVTPAMAQAYVPTNDTTGIKSIVNTATPIINQGGGDGPPGAPPGATDPGITSDDYGFGVDDPTGMGYELTDKDKSDISGQKTKNTAMGLMAALSFAMNPIGFFIGRYAKDRYKTYKENKAKEEAREAEREAERKSIQDRLNQGMTLSEIGRQSYTGPGQAFEAGNTPSGGGYTGGKETDTSPGGYNSPRRDGGLMGRGGSRRRSYFKGGIVSLRRR
jgi:hypothetical protein